MKINTKVVFEWSPKSKQYEEVYCDSYEHDGEVAECQYRLWNDPSGQTRSMQSRMGQQGYGSNNLQFNPGGQQFSGLPQQGFGSSSGWLPGGLGQSDQAFNPFQSFGNLSGSAPAAAPSGDQSASTAAATKAGSWMEQNQGKMTGLGAAVGAVVGYRQAKSQRKGLGVAIEEIDPLKGEFMGARERQLGLAEAYRPGGRYSQYMGGQIMSQAAESAGQESQRMVASGITSPSMMRAMAKQSRTTARHALPGMELQLSQMALPYEQMGAQSLTQYGGVVEQLASLKGARAAIDPWTAALSGGSEGMMAAGQMMSSFMPSPV